MYIVGRSDHVSDTSSAFLAAILEYLTAEIFDVTGNATRGSNIPCTISHPLQLSIRDDGELNDLLEHVAVPGKSVARSRCLTLIRNGPGWWRFFI
ncbi:hypothetical protein BC939DRAFT_458325 [Gamsiella multidivaricata]|uniref:uncharacterized protein n=1 Tax=Gamsiella multidivaricata TaxID=101098 RepID=UPI0022206E17|nr:uncharacterized protein BC939DRAFT_458325 [Gamsiella multidivaricata]KAI7820320.1 hypothetical protein BC939DRAFT_458325 [Gamsiella multidivaricata]